MSDRAECELEQELKKYKGLTEAHGISSCPILSGTYLADYLLSEPELSDELIGVDAALRCLEKRINEPRVRPILSKLFDKRSVEKAMKAWDQALSEIFAFAHFESLGILHSIGWPSDFPGEDAPFDFAVDIEGKIVAGDVKPANGSGYRLLEQTVRRCIAKQATTSGGINPQITVRYHEPLTQEVVGDNIRDFAQNFSQKITSHTMTESQTFDLTIGATRLTVILGDTKQVGGGITGSSVLSDALAPTFRTHIEEKGKHGSKYDVRYFLAYVRLPGRGSSDIKSHASFGDTLAKAIKPIERPVSDWLGALFLCPGTPNTEPRFFESSNPNWPTGLSVNVLSHRLGATLTPVLCLIEDIHEGKTRFSLSYGASQRSADDE
jgi:hypothetical protein